VSQSTNYFFFLAFQKQFQSPEPKVSTENNPSISDTCDLNPYDLLIALWKEKKMLCHIPYS